MQAIVTKLIHSANGVPTGVRARCYGKTIKVAWDDALHVEGNHDAAARQLAERMEWVGHKCKFGKPYTLVKGSLPGERSEFVYVLVPLISFQTAGRCIAEAISGDETIASSAQAVNERFGNGP